MSFAPLVRPAERAVCLLGAVAGGLSQTFQRTIADAVAIRERKFAFAVKTRKPEMNPERFIPGGVSLFCNTRYYKEKERLVNNVVAGGFSCFTESHCYSLTFNFNAAILDSAAMDSP